MNPAVRVILVHGLFYGRRSLFVLGRRLQRCGFDIEYLAYAPTRAGLEGSAAALVRQICAGRAPLVHLVGHSFGGLVILKALQNAPSLPDGRAVLLGSPLQGSGVARRLLGWAPGRFLLRAAGPPLAAGTAHVPAGHEIAAIAGSRGLGLGRLTGARLGPSDGTVGVAETVAEGLSGSLLLPVSHTGMLFSPRVAAATVCFLLHGRFDAPAEMAA